MSRAAGWQGTLLHRVVGVALTVAILFLRLLETLLGGGSETSLQRTRLRRVFLLPPYLWMKQRINVAHARASDRPTTSETTP